MRCGCSLFVDLIITPINPPGLEENSNRQIISNPKATMSTTPTSTATPNSQVTPANEKYKATPAHCLRALRNFIVTEKKALNVFYPDDGSLTPVADIASTMVNTLQERGCTFEKAMQFSILTLYDLVVLLGLMPNFCFACRICC
jgi:short subunit dehydrogenase-like uncharacterized protein